MLKEPKLPRKLKRGDGTAAKADGAECLTGIGVTGRTGLKDVSVKKPGRITGI